MKEILPKLAQLPYFRTSNLEALFPNLKKASLYRKISRWRAKGFIIGLKKGFFVTEDYKKNNIADENYLCYLANILRYPSYVSGTFVLQAKGILTDITFPVTSITTKTTRKYHSPLGDFLYSSIAPNLYQGYERLLYKNEPIYVATLAKALFDYLYLKYLGKKMTKESIIERERLDLSIFKLKDITEFKKYCKLSKNKILIELSSALFENK